MAKPRILTGKQVLFLHLLSENPEINKKFYFTGGTALAEYYVPYRYSEDLDFFSMEEIDIESVNVFFKSIQLQLGYKRIEINTSFNRNLFFLEFPDSELKIEFTYFPFPQIEKPKKIEGIKINSILDIAVDKLFTIYQKPRSRDFMDLYMICKKYDFSPNDLTKKVRLKFDWNIDPIKLGSQFMLSTQLKDYPRLTKPLKEEMWQGFFLDWAKKFGGEVLTG